LLHIIRAALRKFIQLDDTPNSYSGLAGKLFKVNSSETALEPSTNTDSEIADAVSKRHTQNTDHIIKDADGDTLIDVEESADKDEIVGKVAGVEALRVHSSGILDLPKQSGCAGYLGTAQSINNASVTKVMFDTKEYDLQNEYDNVTNYRFTATKDGKYLITCKITFSDALNTTDRIFVSIHKNGSEYKNSDVGGSNGTYQGPIISTVVHLVAGDYIEFYVYQATGASKSLYNSPSYTYFSITKVQ